LPGTEHSRIASSFGDDAVLFSDRATEKRTPRTHSLHYSDTNEVGIAADQEMLSRIEMMFEIGPLKDRERQVRVSVDVIVEG
jgi:hypothetical protein